eukprot:CAMPEP_0198724980 /NCGR_PEP_ID=MMETSP1475-20131203/2353_1 /TAXON_ID= ORGANISM="Unidentified sp., Strain CCMP1999" /NCGR_SAMPLE_ID=MMETSP1475 /ASSEMBLY_ACC=CAM_ASM_001111 /LENGTH=577 /DNA_ID=CAMNT_0044486637 /DNA_START=351 /DNA_END=2084 /DNA_ORIENTATION=-
MNQMSFAEDTEGAGDNDEYLYIPRYVLDNVVIQQQKRIHELEEKVRRTRERIRNLQKVGEGGNSQAPSPMSSANPFEVYRQQPTVANVSKAPNCTQDGTTEGTQQAELEKEPDMNLEMKDVLVSPPTTPVPQQIAETPLSADLQSEEGMPCSEHSQTRYWTQEEHQRFLRACQMYGDKNYVAISRYVRSRTPKQVRTHAQKYQKRLEREAARRSGTSNMPRFSPPLSGPMSMKQRDAAPHFRAVVPQQHQPSGMQKFHMPPQTMPPQTMPPQTMPPQPIPPRPIPAPRHQRVPASAQKNAPAIQMHDATQHAVVRSPHMNMSGMSSSAPAPLRPAPAAGAAHGTMTNASGTSSGTGTPVQQATVGHQTRAATSAKTEVTNAKAPSVQPVIQQTPSKAASLATKSESGAADSPQASVEKVSHSPRSNGASAEVVTVQPATSPSVEEPVQVEKKAKIASEVNKPNLANPSDSGASNANAETWCEGLNGAVKQEPLVPKNLTPTETPAMDDLQDSQPVENNQEPKMPASTEEKCATKSEKQNADVDTRAAHSDRVKSEGDAEVKSTMEASKNKGEAVNTD